MPWISRPLKITSLTSSVIGPEGIPSTAIRPPWFIASSIWLNAASAPHISRPTSKPSVMPSSAITGASGSVRTSTTRLAPCAAAISSR